jgi:hypothetical protein
MQQRLFLCNLPKPDLLRLRLPPRRVSRTTHRFNQQVGIIILSLFFGALIGATVPTPAMAQYAAPTGSAVPCLGFYCGIATALNANALFTPIADGINAATTLVSAIFAWQFITRGAEAVRRGMNDDDWKSKASEAFAVAAVGVMLFVISYGFATAT